MRCSSARMRASRVSTVSFSWTGTAACRMIGPVSTPSVTKWTVHPDTLTPQASACCWAFRPGNDGRSAGWMFMIRLGYASMSTRVTIFMYPASATSSTLCFRRISRTARSYASRLSGRSLYGAGSRNTSSTPWRRARSSACASFLLLMTTAIRAVSLPASIASMIACRLEPRPEARTPRRSFALGIAHPPLALFNHPDPEGLIAMAFRQPHHVTGAIRSHHEDQADTQIEHPRHFVVIHLPSRLDQSKDGGGSPCLARDDRPTPGWQDSGQVLGQPASRDMGDRADLLGVSQRPDGPHVDPRRTEQGFPQCFRLARHPFAQRQPGLFQQHLAGQRIAVAVQSRGRQADHDVARLDTAPVNEPLPLDHPDRKAGQIVLAFRIESRHLGGPRPVQRATGLAAAFDAPGDDRFGLSHRQLPDRHVIQKEERLGSTDRHVVDAHRDQIDADRVMASHQGGDLQLGPHPVRARDQDRVLIFLRIEAEEAGKSSDVRQDFRAERRADEGADALDELVAGVDVNPCLFVVQVEAGLLYRGTGILPEQSGVVNATQTASSRCQKCMTFPTE